MAARADVQVCKRIFPEGCVEGENKGYSRDYEAQWPPMRGRIRVRLFDAEGKATNPEITTRKQLFLKVAELIPRMPSRQAGYVDPQQVRPAAAMRSVRASPHADQGSAQAVVAVAQTGGVPWSAFAVALPFIALAASCCTASRPPVLLSPPVSPVQMARPGGWGAERQRGKRGSRHGLFLQAALGAAEAKIAGALKKNTGGSNKKKKGQKK